MSDYKFKSKKVNKGAQIASSGSGGYTYTGTNRGKDDGGFIQTDLTGAVKIDKASELDRLGAGWVTHEDQSDNIGALAASQGGWEQAANLAIGGSYQFAAGLLDNFDYDLPDMAAMMAGDEKKYGSWLSEITDDLRKKGSEYQIYQDGRSFSDPAYWMNMAQSAAYTGGLILGSFVEQAALSAVTAATFGAGGGVQGASLAAKASRFLKVAHNATRNKMIGNLAFGSWKGVHEGYKNGLETFKETEKKYLSLGYSKEDAIKNAAKAASLGYKMEIAPLMMLNALQFGTLSKFDPYQQAKSTLKTGFSSGVESLAEASLKGVKNKWVKGGLNKLADGVSEGVEEGIQGWISDYAQHNTLTDTNDKFKSFENWTDKRTDEVIAGAFMGIVFGVMGDAKAQASKSLETYQDKQRKKADPTYRTKTEQVGDFLDGAKERNEKLVGKLAAAQKAGQTGKRISDIHEEMSMQEIQHAIELDHMMQTGDTAFQSYTNNLQEILDAANNGDQEKLKTLGFDNIDSMTFIKENYGRMIDQAIGFQDKYKTAYRDYGSHTAAQNIAYAAQLADNQEVAIKKDKIDLEAMLTKDKTYQALSENDKNLFRKRSLRAAHLAHGLALSEDKNNPEAVGSFTKKAKIAADTANKEREALEAEMTPAELEVSKEIMKSPIFNAINTKNLEIIEREFSNEISAQRVKTWSDPVFVKKVEIAAIERRAAKAKTHKAAQKLIKDAEKRAGKKLKADKKKKILDGATKTEVTEKVTKVNDKTIPKPVLKTPPTPKTSKPKVTGARVGVPNKMNTHKLKKLFIEIDGIEQSGGTLTAYQEELIRKYSVQYGYFLEDEGWSDAVENLDDPNDTTGADDKTELSREEAEAEILEVLRQDTPEVSTKKITLKSLSKGDKVIYWTNLKGSRQDWETDKVVEVEAVSKYGVKFKEDKNWKNFKDGWHNVRVNPVQETTSLKDVKSVRSTIGEDAWKKFDKDKSIAQPIRDSINRKVEAGTTLTPREKLMKEHMDKGVVEKVDTKAALKAELVEAVAQRDFELARADEIEGQTNKFIDNQKRAARDKYVEVVNDIKKKYEKVETGTEIAEIERKREEEINSIKDVSTNDAEAYVSTVGYKLGKFWTKEEATQAVKAKYDAQIVEARARHKEENNKTPDVKTTDEELRKEFGSDVVDGKPLTFATATDTNLNIIEAELGREELIEQDPEEYDEISPLDEDEFKAYQEDYETRKVAYEAKSEKAGTPTQEEGGVSGEVAEAFAVIKSILAKEDVWDSISSILAVLPITKSKLVEAGKITLTRDGKTGKIKSREFTLNSEVYNFIKEQNFELPEVSTLLHELIHWVTETDSKQSGKFREDVSTLYNTHKKDIQDGIRSSFPVDAELIISEIEAYPVELLTYTLTNTEIFDALTEITVDKEVTLIESLLLTLLDAFYSLTANDSNNVASELISILATYEQSVYKDSSAKIELEVSDVADDSANFYDPSELDIKGAYEKLLAYLNNFYEISNPTLGQLSEHMSKLGINKRAAQSALDWHSGELKAAAASEVAGIFNAFEYDSDPTNEKADKQAHKHGTTEVRDPDTGEKRNKNDSSKKLADSNLTIATKAIKTTQDTTGNTDADDKLLENDFIDIYATNTPERLNAGTELLIEYAADPDRIPMYVDGSYGFDGEKAETMFFAQRANDMGWEKDTSDWTANAPMVIWEMRDGKKFGEKPIGFVHTEDYITDNTVAGKDAADTKKLIKAAKLEIKNLRDSVQKSRGKGVKAEVQHKGSGSFVTKKEYKPLRTVLGEGNTAKPKLAIATTGNRFYDVTGGEGTTFESHHKGEVNMEDAKGDNGHVYMMVEGTTKDAPTIAIELGRSPISGTQAENTVVAFIERLFMEKQPHKQFFEKHTKDLGTKHNFLKKLIKIEGVIPDGSIDTAQKFKGLERVRETVKAIAETRKNGRKGQQFIYYIGGYMYYGVNKGPSTYSPSSKLQEALDANEKFKGKNDLDFINGDLEVTSGITVLSKGQMTNSKHFADFLSGKGVEAHVTVEQTGRANTTSTNRIYQSVVAGELEVPQFKKGENGYNYEGTFDYVEHLEKTLTTNKVPINIGTDAKPRYVWRVQPTIKYKAIEESNADPFETKSEVDNSTPKIEKLEEEKEVPTLTNGLKSTRGLKKLDVEGAEVFTKQIFTEKEAQQVFDYIERLYAKSYTESHLQSDKYSNRGKGRRSMYFSDSDYTYSGVTRPKNEGTAEEKRLLKKLTEALGFEEGYFDMMLINEYRDGNQKIGFHTDNEGILNNGGQLNPSVVTVSFGEERTMVLKGKDGREVNIPMNSGLALVMGRNGQTAYKHGIKAEANKGKRFSVTLRHNAIKSGQVDRVAEQQEEAQQEGVEVTTPKSVFSVEPIKGRPDHKAVAKSKIATQYIGFADGIKGSSTANYAKQAGNVANTGNYSKEDVVFVSIGGKRGNAEQRKAQQDRTIREAIDAVEAGATIVTDDKSYIDSNRYNEGEKRLYANMEAKGYIYKEVTVDGQVLGTWSKPSEQTTTQTQEEEVDLPTEDKGWDDPDRIRRIKEKMSGIDGLELWQQIKVVNYIYSQLEGGTFGGKKMSRHDVMLDVVNRMKALLDTTGDKVAFKAVIDNIESLTSDAIEIFKKSSQVKEEDLTVDEIREKAQMDGAAKHFAKDSSISDGGKLQGSYLLKKLFAIIPKRDTSGKDILTFGNLPDYIGFDVIDTQIKSIMNSPYEVPANIEAFLEQLDLHSKTYPHFKTIIERLTDPSNKETMSQLQMTFVNGYALTAQKSTFVMWQEQSSPDYDGNRQFTGFKKNGRYRFQVLYSNSNEVDRAIRDNWDSRLHAKKELLKYDVEEQSFVVDRDHSKKVLEALAEAANVKAPDFSNPEKTKQTLKRIRSNVGNLNNQDLTTFLESFGIQLSEEALNELRETGYQVIDKNGAKSNLLLKEMFDPSSTSGTGDGLFGSLMSFLGNSVDVGKNLVVGENGENNPLKKISTILQKVSKIEAKHSEYTGGTSYRDGDKTIQQFPTGKFATMHTNILKTDREYREIMQSKAFHKHSSVLKLLQDSERFRQVYELSHMGNTSMKEAFKKVFGENTVNALSTADYDMLELAMFTNQDVTKVRNTGNAYQNLPTRVMRLLFPTMSDKSAFFALQTVGINFTADMVTDGNPNDATLEFMYEQMVQPELDRIFDHLSRDGKSDIKGYDIGAKLFNMVPGLNNMKFAGEDGSLSFVNLFYSEAETPEREKELLEARRKGNPDMDKFKVAAKKLIAANVKAEVDKKSKEFKTNFITTKPVDKNDLEKGEIRTLRFIDEKYLASKRLNEKATIEDKIEVVAMDFVLNKMIGMANMHMTHIGDPAQYSKFKIDDNFVDGRLGVLSEDADDNVFIQKIKDGTYTNLGKRLAAQPAPRTRAEGSDKGKYTQIFMQDYIDRSENIAYIGLSLDGKVMREDEITVLDLYNKHIQSGEDLTHEDYDKLRKLSGYKAEEKDGDNKNFIKLKHGQVTKKFPKTAAYFSLEGSDAQEYTTPLEALHTAWKAGKITDDVLYETATQIEAQRGHVKKYPGVPIPKELFIKHQDLKMIFQPRKPLHTGFMNDEKNNTMRFMYIKSSSVALLPQWTQGLQIDGLRQAMEAIQTEDDFVEVKIGGMIDGKQRTVKMPKKGVRASYQTANKVGAKSNPARVFNSNNTYNSALNKLNEDGTINTKDLRNSSLTLDRANWGLQLDVPTKFTKDNETYVTVGSQPLKLLFGDGVTEMTGFEYNTQIYNTEQLAEILGSKKIQKLKSYEGNITPEENTVFVFGSNPEGRHGAGAAKIAKNQFGAIYGQGEGLQGNSYALPTKDLRVKENKSFKSISPKAIKESIKTLYETARANPGKDFKVGYRNKANETTLNGYTGAEMIDMFNNAGNLPSNIVFSKEWVDTGLLNKTETVDLSTGKNLHKVFDKTWVDFINIKRKALLKEFHLNEDFTPIDVLEHTKKVQEFLLDEAKGKDYPKQSQDALTLKLTTEISFNGETLSTQDLTIKEVEKVKMLKEKETLTRNEEVDLELLIGMDVDTFRKLDVSYKHTNSDFTVPLWLSPDSNKYENLMNSVVNNRLINIKLPGNSLVVASEAGFRREVARQVIGSEEATKKGTINVYWGQAESETSTKMLSNLAPRKFTWEEKEYGSVEHAYQSNKSGTFDKATYDKYVKVGGYGKKIRGKGTVTQMKAADSLGLMKNLVVESFKQNPDSDASKKLVQYGKFTHNTNQLIDKAFLEGLSLAQEALPTEVSEATKISNLSQIIYTDHYDHDYGALKGANEVDGKLQKTQVFMASRFTNNEGKLIEFIFADGTPNPEYVTTHANGSLMLKKGKIAEELLNITSFRIPTSSHVSMAQVEIAGFLPVNVGDMLVVPKNLTVQMGLDFDVDKQTTYHLNTYTDADGKTKVLDKKGVEFLIRAKDPLITGSAELRRELREELQNLKGKRTEIFNSLNEGQKEALSAMAFLHSEDVADADLIIKTVLGETDYSAEDFDKVEDLLKTDLSSLKNQKIEEREKFKLAVAELKRVFKENEKALGKGLSKRVKDKMREQLKEKLYENEIIKIHGAVLSNPKVQQKVNAVLSMESANANAKRLTELKSSNEDISNWSPFTNTYQRSKMMSARVGKLGISVFSNALVLHALMNQVDAEFVLQKEYWAKGAQTPSYIPNTFEFGILKSEGILGLLKTLGKGERTIAEVWAELQNIATDNEKEQAMAALGINAQTINSLISMVSQGFDRVPGKEKDASGKFKMIFAPAYLLSQPIVQEYARRMSEGVGQTKDFNANLKEEIIESLMGSQYTGEGSKKELDALRVARKYLTGPKMTEMIEEGTYDEESQYFQRVALDLFLAFDDSASQISEVQRIATPGSSGLGKSRFDVMSKKALIENLDSNRTISNVTKLVGEYVRDDEGNLTIEPTTPSGAMMVQGLNMADGVFGKYHPYDSDILSAVFRKVISKLPKINSEYKKIETKQQILQEWKKYQVTKEGLGFGITPENIQSERARLQKVEAGDKHTLGSYLQELLWNKDYAFLKDNPLLNSLQFKKRTVGEYDSLDYNNSGEVNFDETAIYMSIASLLTDTNRALPNFNGKKYSTKSLALDMIKNAYLEGGIQKASQYVKFIPVAILDDQFGPAMKELHNSLTSEGRIDRMETMLDMEIFTSQYLRHNAQKMHQSELKTTIFSEIDGNKVKQDIGVKQAPEYKFKLPYKKGAKIDEYKVFSHYSKAKNKSVQTVYQYDSGDGTYYRVGALGSPKMSEYQYGNPGATSNVNKNYTDTTNLIGAAQITLPTTAERTSEEPALPTSSKFGIGTESLESIVKNVLKAEIGQETRVHLQNLVDKGLIPKDVPVTISNEIGTNKAAYNFDPKDKSGKIMFSESLLPGMKDSEIAHTLLKELIHSATVVEMSKHLSVEDGSFLSEDLTTVPRDIRRIVDMFNIYAKSKRVDQTRLQAVKAGDRLHKGESKTVYPATSVFEFVEVLYTEPSFRDILNKVPYGDRKKPLYDKVMEYLTSLFNNITDGSMSQAALAEILSVMDRQAKVEKKEKTLYERAKESDTKAIKLEELSYDASNPFLSEEESMDNNTETEQPAKPKHTYTYDGTEVVLEFELGEEQKAALDTVLDHILKPSKDTVLTVAGSAGTGKTTIIGVAHKILAKKMGEERMVYFAPTHAATIPLALSTLKSGNKQFPFTTQSSLNKYNGLEWTNKVKEAVKGIIPVVVIDEASMLEDLNIDDFEAIQEAKGYKVILMGDAAQLPAISGGYGVKNGVRISEADARSQKLKVYKPISKAFTDYKMVELTEVFRQKESTHLDILTKIRENTELINYQTEENTAELQFLGVDDWNDAVLKSFKEDFENTIVIAHRNASVADSNKKVRESLGFRGPLQKGESILGYGGVNSKSILKNHVANSVKYTVTDVQETLKWSHIDGYYIKVESSLLKEVSKGYDDISKRASMIYAPIFTGDPLGLGADTASLDKNKAFITDQMLKVQAAFNEAKRTRRWYSFYQGAEKKFKDEFAITNIGFDIYLTRDGKEIKLLSELSLAQKKSLKKSHPYHIMEKGVDFGYAITVHKSQGSTVKNVFFDQAPSTSFETILVDKKGEQVNTEANALVYVAWSRASDRLVVKKGVTVNEWVDPSGETKVVDNSPGNFEVVSEDPSEGMYQEGETRGADNFIDDSVPPPTNEFYDPTEISESDQNALSLPEEIKPCKN